MSFVGYSLFEKLSYLEVRDFLMDSTIKLKCIDCMYCNVISKLNWDDDYDVCLDVNLMCNVYCVDWEKFIYMYGLMWMWND